jgi:adenylate cyclase
MAVLASPELHAMRSAGPERRLSAILNADVAGYSRLMGEYEAATMGFLKRYRLLVADVVARDGGRVVDATGDNMLADFPSVVGAVHAALAIQDELTRLNAGIASRRRMELRVGVNLGDVLVDGDRIYGDGVNIAARVQTLAEPGGVCISGTVFDQVETKLPLTYEPLGEQTVKNIARPVRIYRVRAAAGGRPSTAGPPPVSADPRPSVAVLPFVDLSGDSEQEYFAEGIAEDVIVDLAKLSGLTVIDRQSAFRYKNRSRPLHEIARELGVRFVLDGTVRRVGTRVRITAQLIEARSGRHLWAERYDRQLADVFAVQDDITRRIVEELDVVLTSGEQARFLRRATRNVEAYDAILRGQPGLHALNLEGSASARVWFKRAAELDPTCAAAHAFIGYTYLNDLTMGPPASRAESFMRLQAASERALELDPEDTVANALGAWVHLVRRDHAAALAAAEHAVALAPGAAAVQTVLAMMLNMNGRPQEALVAAERATRLCPIESAVNLRARGVALRLLGRYPEAVLVFEQARRGEPHSTLPLLGLAITHALAGNLDEARSMVAAVLAIDPRFSAEGLLGLHRDPAVVEQDRHALRRAGLS